MEISTSDSSLILDLVLETNVVMNVINPVELQVTCVFEHPNQLKCLYFTSQSKVQEKTFEK